MRTSSVSERSRDLGRILREWRVERGLTQRQLAEATGMSAKHVSFIETGRAMPSRIALMLLARALGMSARDRQALLGAAGHSPARLESPLDPASLPGLGEALALVLAHQEPCSSVVIDRAWRLVMVNRAFASFAATVGVQLPEPLSLVRDPHINLLDLFVRSDALRPWIANWEEVVPNILARARRELTSHGDPALRAVLRRVRSAPDVARAMAASSLTQEASLGYFVPLEVGPPGGPTSRLLGTVTTLGTALDASVRELRIETYLPFDGPRTR